MQLQFSQFRNGAGQRGHRPKKRIQFRDLLRITCRRKAEKAKHQRRHSKLRVRYLARASGGAFRRNERDLHGKHRETL